MKISSGLSQIILPKVSAEGIKNQKIYLWPEYKEGRVHKIGQIKQRNTPYIVLNSKSKDEMNDIIRLHSVSSEPEYSGNASSHRKLPSAERGLLFDAIV